MVHSRKRLSKILRQILGNNHVYYQPPETIKIEYDAIIYSLKDVDGLYADNRLYHMTRHYQLNFISQSPDNTVVERLMEDLNATFVRRYTQNGLYYDVLEINF